MQRRDFISVLAAGAASTRWPGASAERADLVLFGGIIHSLAPGARPARAIAVAGDRIVALGTDAAIRRFVDRKTETIDLAGRPVIPGINDSHFHAIYTGLSRPPFSIDVGFPGARSIAEVAELVRTAARAKQPGEWIQGHGWDRPYFAEGRPPTKEDLDRAAPDNPVVLTEFSGHAVWVNSKALAAAGITRDTDPPAGGVIAKDGGGEPTGVLFEGAAGLVHRIVPPPTAAERDAAIGLATDWMLENGITSFTEPGIDLAGLELLAARARAGRLGVRATVLLQGGRSAASVAEILAARRPLAGVDERWLRVAGVKLFADGIPTNNKTAWLHDPYVDGGRGKLVTDGATDADRVRELHRMIKQIHDAGLQVGTHATGDAAIDAVVDGYVAAMIAAPRPDPRHYVIHADLVSPKTLATMARRRIGANFNASIKHLIADGQRQSIGPVRAAYEWPYRTALAAGVVVATGSDAPVTDGDWRQGLTTAVLRLGKQSGAVSGPAERISWREGLATFTVNGAWQDRAERWKGTLEPGRVADLVVLDGPLAGAKPESYPKLEVTLTVVGGRVGYRRA